MSALPSPDHTDAVLDASLCPAAFGDEDGRLLKRERRLRLLEHVLPGAFAVTLTHRGHWVEPVPARFSDVQLIATHTADVEESVALVTLDAEGSDCLHGTYALHVDDAVGADGAVLAILDGILLFEMNEELMYLRVPGGDEPMWRMAWHPTFTIERPRAATPAPTHRVSPRRR
ncbi:MAG: hypothetical protein HYZ27_03005 [Deltaproteobacteria bacterium]|nr:hypothetical protein [Deltaproteobacteria bacterium]